MRLTARLATRFAVVAGVASTTAAATAAVLAGGGLGAWTAGGAGALAGLLVGLLVAALALHRTRRVTAALRSGVAGFRARDYSLRLAVGGRDELADLADVYNAIGDALSRERSDIRQRELLLESALEASPAAVILLDDAERVLFASRAARRLFFAGRRLEGHGLDEILAGCPAPLAEALGNGRDALVSVPVDAGDEVFHVTRRVFDLNVRRHVLLIVRHMTPELRRQEIAVWKKVVRVINHELANSLAPIRSLVNSARLLRRQGDTDRLDEVLDTIGDCADRLHRFVEGYARLARLPDPRLESVDLRRLLDELRQLEPFGLDGDVPPLTVRVDRAQVQQVLVNLLKNAREAGSPEASITVAVEDGRDGTVAILVRDRGSGMDEETMARALVPFYSSKREGTGLGLSLAREILEAHGGRLELAAREGGGLEVACRVPRADGAAPAV